MCGESCQEDVPREKQNDCKAVFFRSPNFFLLTKKKKKSNWRIYLRTYCSWLQALKPKSAVPCSGRCWRHLPTCYRIFLSERTWQLCSTAVEQQKEFSRAEVVRYTRRAVWSLVFYKVWVLCSFHKTAGSTVCMWLAAHLNIASEFGFRVLSVWY